MSQFDDLNQDKVLDIKLANKLGWKPKTKLDEAITKTYKNFLENNKIV
mgnify:FL=1